MLVSIVFRKYAAASPTATATTTSSVLVTRDCIGRASLSKQRPIVHKFQRVLFTAELAEVAAPARLRRPCVLCVGRRSERREKRREVLRDDREAVGEDEEPHAN